MKLNKFFMGLGAVVALMLTACSSDEPAPTGPDTPTGEGETLTYMKVTLSDVASDGSRASAGDFEVGSEKEHKVATADFYFYSAEGAYVTNANVWNNGTASAEGSNNNIEFEGKTVLVLNPLKEGDKAPKYVVTVLNKPSNFEPGTTLAAMEQQLASAANNDKSYMNGEYFIMSTTSFDNGPTPTGETGNTYEYFTTKVPEDAYLRHPSNSAPTEEELDKLTPVEIYVERLAVKVGVNLNINEKECVVVKEGENGENVYVELTLTKGDAVNTSNGATEFPIAESKFYIKIEGWGLNCLANNQYMMKNLLLEDNASTPDGFEWKGWNAPTYHRSYWAKSWVYNANDYTDKVKYYSLENWASKVVKDEESKEITDITFEGENKMGGNLYCPENTNRASVLKGDSKNYQNKTQLEEFATHAMICARIYEKHTENDKDVFTPVTMVKHGAILYSYDSFMAWILNAVKTSSVTGAKKYVYVTEVTEEVEGSTVTKQIYTSIGKEDIELVEVDNPSEGQVTVALTEAAKGKTWYSYTGDKIPTTPEAFSPVTTAEIDNALNSIITNSANAFCYNDGLMHYDVPIEHFGPGSSDDYKEGYYGVVRNHKYQLTINSLKELGNSIYNPDKVIIPKNNKGDRYALGVNVRILSWKLVNQTVDL